MLENSPNVLSVEKLCNEGWSLNWNAHKTPALTPPDGLMIHLKVRCFAPSLDEQDKLWISHNIRFNSKSKPRFQALPTVEESVENPEADGAVDKVPFSPVDLEAGQDTPEPTDDVRIERLREKALSKIHLMTHIPKNPFCLGRLRAKLNAKQARRRHINSEASAFGDIVTADHLIARDADGGGIDYEKVATYHYQRSFLKLDDALPNRWKVC